jgi:hypothetical protein
MQFLPVFHRCTRLIFGERVVNLKIEVFGPQLNPV